MAGDSTVSALPALTWLLVAVCFAASLAGTHLLKRYALRRGLMDVPNVRSSHTVPTPRSGGAAIYLAFAAGVVVLWLGGAMSGTLFWALGGGGTAVALVGWLDDRRHLSAGVRLVVHFGAAIWALAWLGGTPPISFGGAATHFGWSGYVLGALTIVWTINLFNFMDGIDGLAGSEAVFVASAGGLLAVASGAASSVAAPALLFAAACLGFLVWNWPRASIFMGDVGSGFIGYTIAVLALASGVDDPVAPIAWWILGGYFFLDATITLVRRFVRRERLSQAHRSHAYQWLATRWNSHRKVTLAAVLLNILWLLPMAALVMLYPQRAGWFLLAAFLPVGIGILVLDAQRRRATAASAGNGKVDAR